MAGDRIESLSEILEFVRSATGVSLPKRWCQLLLCEYMRLKERKSRLQFKVVLMMAAMALQKQTTDIGTDVTDWVYATAGCDTDKANWWEHNTNREWRREDDPIVRNGRINHPMVDGLLAGKWTE